MSEAQDGLQPDARAPMGRELMTLRATIARVDEEIVRLIAERVQLAQQAGALKRAAGLPVRDPVQEAVVLDRAGVFARSRGLDADAVRQVFDELLALARAAQRAGER